MDRVPRWIRNGAFVALAATAAVVVIRRAGRGGGLVPIIGGDTWAPVPVKDTRPD